MKKSHAVLAVTMVLSLLLFSGCERLAEIPAIESIHPELIPTDTTPREIVVVSDEIRLSDSDLFTTTTIEKDGLYFLSKDMSSTWYKLDVTNNQLKPTSDNFFINENLKPDLAEQLGVNEIWISFFPSPSNRLILVHAVRSTENLNEGTPIPTVTDGLTVPTYLYHSEIYLFDTENDKTTKLGKFEGDISKVVWSPNENYLIISRNAIEVHEPNSPMGNWIVNSQTGSILQIPIEPISCCLPDPRLVSSDGTKAVFYTFAGEDGPDYLLYDFVTGTRTALGFVDEGQSAFNLWWYRGEEEILFLTYCGDYGIYSVAGFNITTMQRIEPSAACFNIERFSFVSITTDSGRYLIYRHTDDPTLIGRTVSITTIDD